VIQIQEVVIQARGDPAQPALDVFNIIACYVWKQDNTYTFNVVFDTSGPAANSIDYSLIYEYDPTPLAANESVNVSLNDGAYSAYIEAEIEDMPIADIINGTGEGSLQLNLTINTSGTSAQYIIGQDQMTWQGDPPDEP